MAGDDVVVGGGRGCCRGRRRGRDEGLCPAPAGFSGLKARGSWPGIGDALPCDGWGRCCCGRGPRVLPRVFI
jgi:hypothetical protein